MRKVLSIFAVLAALAATPALAEDASWDPVAGATGYVIQVGTMLPPVAPSTQVTISWAAFTTVPPTACAARCTFTITPPAGISLMRWGAKFADGSVDFRKGSGIWFCT